MAKIINPLNNCIMKFKFNTFQKKVLLAIAILSIALTIYCLIDVFTILVADLPINNGLILAIVIGLLIAFNAIRSLVLLSRKERQ
ncbi:MAG: hypothetical protein RR132_01100 [Rikenellaceae bacterium]